MNPRALLGLSKAEEREFTAMDRAMRDAGAWLDDPAMLRMAHPVRLMAAPVTAQGITIITMAEPRHQGLVRELLAKRVGTIEIFKELERRGDERLRAFYSMHTGTAEVTGGFGNELPPPIRKCRLGAVSRRLSRFGQFLAAIQCTQSPAQHDTRCG